MIAIIKNHNRKICNEFYSLNEMGLFILNYYFIFRYGLSVKYKNILLIC